MPRKTPLPDRERQIGQRLRLARERTGLTLAALAKKIQIDSNRLGSYEHGRNPVPYWIANQIAFEADVCQRWLATGQLPMTPFLPVIQPVNDAIPPTLTFSAIYDALLTVVIDEEIEVAKRAHRLEEGALDGSCFEHIPHLFSGPSAHILTSLKVTFNLATFTAATLPFSCAEQLITEISRVLDKYRNQRDEHGKIWYEQHQKEEAEYLEKMLAMVRERLSPLIQARTENRRASRIGTKK